MAGSRPPADDDALLTLRLPSRPEAVSAARKALASLNGDLHLVSEGRLADVQLMASELVTNAIRHSERDDVSMVVRAGATVMRVEVGNAGALFDERDRREPTYDAAGGWGLRIVELMAHRWGVEPRDEEVCVWFEVDRPDSEVPLRISGEAPPPRLVHTTHDGDDWTIALGGEIDLYNSTSIKPEFELILGRVPAPAVLRVDLGQVTFIDSVGIAVLISAHQRAVSVGCRFTVSSMSPVVSSVLQMSGLTDRLTADGCGNDPD